MKSINKYYCYLILLIPIIYSFTILLNYECDIWFLLSHGRYVLDYGFPKYDFLSMHDGLHFVMQQWLSSIIFYLFYKVFASIGVYIIVWISNIIIVYLLYLLCMKISDNNLFTSCIVTAITSSLLDICFITSRPIIFSLIIFILFLYILESYRIRKSNIIYFLILLSLLEVNLHASMWPVLFILLLPYLIYYLFLYYKRKDNTFFKMILIVLLMIIVGFINPYGVDAMMYSFRSYGVSDINNIIWEMNGFNISSNLGYVKYFSILIFIIMVIVSFIFIRTRKKVLLYQLLLFYGTFLMALFNIRNISLFLICSLPFCVNYLDIKYKYYNKFNKKELIIYLVCFITMIGTIIYNKDNYVLSDEYLGQKEVLNYLSEKSLGNNPIYTMNSHGGFFSFYNYKTYIDTRAEVFIKKNNKKEDIFHEFYLIMTGKIDYYEFLEKYKFKYLVIDKDEPLRRYLINNNDHSYKCVFKSKNLYLYERG